MNLQSPEYKLCGLTMFCITNVSSIINIKGGIGA
jgi:hypothetical protein